MKRKGLLFVFVLILLLVLQSCELVADILGEHGELMKTVYIHNKSRSVAYYAIEFPNSKGEITTEDIKYDNDYFKLKPDSILWHKLTISSLQEESIVFLVWSEDTYNKYTLDEIRDNNIYDYGTIYSYKDLYDMQFVINITDEMFNK